MRVSFELAAGSSVQQRFTCGCSQGTEEEGSSYPAGAGLGCKAGDAERESTSRSRRCTEVEDLVSRDRNH